MARVRRKHRRPPDRSRPWWSPQGVRERIAAFVVLGKVGLAGLIIAGAGWGLDALEARVHAAPRFNQAPDIDWVDVPDGLRETMAAKLAPFEADSGYDPRLCRKIGRALEMDPWVRRVKNVRRGHDLRIVVSCAYRMPAALVQIDGSFYLVDRERVRLPGVYGYQASLPLIQGVDCDPPQPGETWDGDDLAAGLAIARLLEGEPFADQITGIQVHNYGGRNSPDDAHLVLATDRAGSIIKWGSAPGEEIEENSAGRKIAILRHNFERFGRADAGYHGIDVSVYPDRIIVKS